MNQFVKILLIFIGCPLVSLASSNDNYTCVWYGQCGPEDPHKHNCPYDGPPQLLNDSEAETILKKRCPHFFDNEGNDF